VGEREKAGQGGREPGPIGAPPRTWLTPYLLMMLRSWNAYGYELVRQLALFGFGAVDPGTVYRALRELERDGYVTSAWDTSAASGPARRVYTITEAGIAALGHWADALDSYRQTLDRFFRLYTGDANVPRPGEGRGEGETP
jgi:PadR family transcriptional regulator, regulatory protein PadR